MSMYCMYIPSKLKQEVSLYGRKSTLFYSTYLRDALFLRDNQTYNGECEAKIAELQSDTKGGKINDLYDSLLPLVTDT